MSELLQTDRDSILDLVQRLAGLDPPAAERILAVAILLCENADDIGDERLRQMLITLHCGPETHNVAVDVEKVKKRY